MLYFAKVKEQAIIPTKNEEDAGYDLYACIDHDIVIRPHETVMLPTGIATAFDKDYAMILKERGSTGTKGIAQRCGVIDSGFRGEIMVPVTNTTTKPILLTDNPDTAYAGYTIYPTSKAISQAVMVVIPTLETKEISYEQLKAMKSLRQTGMLGSSGK